MGAEELNVSGESTPEVKTQEEVAETKVEVDEIPAVVEAAEVAEEPKLIEEPDLTSLVAKSLVVSEEGLDADEKIINRILGSGKIEATTNELITAGFDPGRMSQYSFIVGRFKLTRLLLVSPYKIEKIK